MKLTPEEQNDLDAAYRTWSRRSTLADRVARADERSSLDDFARIAWEVGYEARQVRERESFASAHGKRAEIVIKALLAIVEPNSTQKISVVRAAVDFIGELEKTEAGECPGRLRQGGAQS